ncbi:hypothetical protein D8Y20_06595 [Mariprofundus sp. EBB-1]|nr:hypothetical protein D8Y20_06595 [Mariprofundus sp. EBB-1]
MLLNSGINAVSLTGFQDDKIQTLVHEKYTGKRQIYGVAMQNFMGELIRENDKCIYLPDSPI